MFSCRICLILFFDCPATTVIYTYGHTLSLHAALPISFIMGMGGKMPRRKQARRTNVKDMRSILRLTYGQELSVRAVSERLKLGKTTVSTYVLRAREAGLAACHCRRAMTMTRRLNGCRSEEHTSELPSLMRSTYA